MTVMKGAVADAMDWTAYPAEIVARLDASSRRAETPCGTGKMIWRRWGERRGSNLPLVLLHGGSGSWTHWIKVVPALSQVTEIWAPDLPGLGDSAMPAAPHTPASAGQVVADGIRKLFPDGEQVHLVAFSFGAHVGTFAAAYLSDRLATFTICGSAALGLPHNRLEFERERNTMSVAESAAVHRTNLARLMIFKPERIDALAIHVQAENIRRARFKSRAFAGTNDIPQTLPHVTAALRAIWGAQDVLATPSVEARYDILRKDHPELQTRTIADAGHWVAYEQPDAFAKAIVELTGLGIGGAIPMITRDDCARLDTSNSLAFARERFQLPDGVNYLDGNSLGALPKGVTTRISEVMTDEWGTGLIRSWNAAGWFEAPERIGAKLAPLLGAMPHEVVVTDTISINLYKALVAAARMRPSRKTIVAQRGNFPSDNHIIDSVARLLDMRVRYVEADAIAGAIDSETALIELSHVSYRTAEIQDMAAVTAAAHAKGALTIWDLAHSSGAVNLQLDRCNVDFAVGCGYKFLNGGPGAPAHMYVAERHHAAIDQPLTGWFSHRAPFDFGHDFVRADGIKSMLCSTPPMLSMLALEAALDAYNDVTMPAVQAKGRALGDLMIKLYDERLAARGFGLAASRDGARRGNHVSVTHQESYRIMQALIGRGVIGDFRAPDVMRFGFGPLYVRFVDIFDAITAIEAIMDTGAWAEVAAPPAGAVT